MAEFFQSMAVLLVIGLFLVTFNMQAFEIPSGSMKTTLLVGDHVLVDRISAAPKTSWVGPLMPYTDVKRGDIIVFLSPAEPGLHIVKRIIGIPGDRIHLRNGEVYRNGVKLDEPYVRHDPAAGPNEYRDEFPSVPALNVNGVATFWQVDRDNYVHDGDIVVPPGKYFGMGDNRDLSLDSRYWGFIPKEHIVGRPMFIYWSFPTPEDQYTKTAVSERVKFFGHVVLHFLTETEWKRSLNYVR